MPYTLPINIDEAAFSEGAISTAPLAKIATRFAEAVMNTAWTEAMALKSEYAAKVQAVTNDSTGALGAANTPTVSAGTVSAPTVTAPGVSIPATIDVGDVTAVFSTEYNAIVQLLSDRFESFLTAHFPNESDVYSAAENWIKGAIQNPESAIPQALRDQVYEEARSRIANDATRAAEEVLATFAARGFPLPTGAAAASVAAIQQKAQEEIAGAARKLAEIAIDMQKFTVEKAMGLRQLALNSTLDYIKTLVAGPDTASRIVGIGYDAQSRLISAASDFYRADISAKEMVAKVQQFNVQTSLEASVETQAAELEMLTKKVSTMVSETESIARMATSMLNNLHTSSGLSVSV